MKKNGLETTKLEKDEELTRVAFLHYEMRQSSQEIAERLSLDKVKVHRLLRLAVKQGMVTLTNKAKTAISSKELQLVRKFQNFGIRDVHIAFSPTGNVDGIREAIYSRAAAYLDSRLSDGDILGLTCGQNVLGAILRFETRDSSPKKNIKIIPFNAYRSWIDGVSEGEINMIDSSPIAVVALAKFGMEEDRGNKAYSLPVFPSLPGQNHPESFEQEDVIPNEVRKMAEDANIVLCGIGSFNINSSRNVQGLLKNSNLTIDEVQKLGWKGEINHQPFNIEGIPFKEIIESGKHNLSRTLLGKAEKYYRKFFAFDLNLIKKIASGATRKVVGISHGEDRVEAICAAIRGKIINTLITSENTADKLLKVDIG